MAYDPGALDAALAAAVGDDPQLVQELRQALRDSAERQFHVLENARNDANWAQASERLKGLAASFGAMQLLAAANLALDSAPGDPVAVRKVKRAVGMLSH